MKETTDASTTNTYNRGTALDLVDPDEKLLNLVWDHGLYCFSLIRQFKAV